jgi:type III pantothenate kinase
MRIITADIGNSKTCLGIFENDSLIEIVSPTQFSKRPDDIVIVSSVKNEIALTYDYNLENYKKDKSYFEMPVNYTTTLGIDRLVCAYKAYHQLAKTHSTLIIDAGTFMTIDFIDSNGFNGGYIFPGINTFLSSYSEGDKLPVLKFSHQDLMDLPHDTNNAILSATNIFLESCMRTIIEKTSPSNIVITGGSGKHIFDILKRLNLKTELQLDLNYLHQSIYLIHQLHLKASVIP